MPLPEPCNQSCPAGPGAAKWAHKLCLPSAALAQTLADFTQSAQPGPCPRHGVLGRTSCSRSALQRGQTPPFALFGACQSLMWAAAAHKHLCTPVPSWDKPHMPPWGWEPRGDPGVAQGRVGLSLFSGNAAGVLWFVHETSEDVFSALPGMTKKGYREHPNTVQGRQPCSTS